MDDIAVAGFNQQRRVFKRRVHQRSKFDLKILQFHGFAVIDNVNLRLFFKLIVLKPGDDMRGSKRRCIDRTLQFRPDVGNGAEMIFVRVGNEQALNIVNFAFQRFRRGEAQLHARKIVVKKSVSAVDDD